jgi:hypothetical protein
MSQGITRKEFLSTTTKTVVAVSACAAGATVVAATAGQLGQAGAIDRAPAAPVWPWPYKKLDPEDIRKRAHKAYYDGGCCYGAFNAMVAALAEVIGEPYTMMPSQMMYFGGGGGAGWGTLCGALNGAAAAISLVADRTSANTLVGELFGWYTEVKFPSDISNDYAVRQAFLVNRNTQPLLQTVPGSVLCHASVSNWCTESGVKASAPERSERCARMTGDVAARAVELLNRLVDGQFKAAFAAPAAVSECLNCHAPTGHVGNVQAAVKMDCTVCHQNWDHLY